MEYIIKFVLVAFTLFIADVFWALYFMKIEERNGVMAGLYGSVIYLLGAFAITQYTEDKTFIIAAVIGAFSGTYVAVEWKKRKDIKSK
jgi:uncharacterized membrane protein (UPF0136 family)